MLSSLGPDFGAGDYDAANSFEYVKARNRPIAEALWHLQCELGHQIDACV